MGFDVDMAELDKLRSSLDEIKETLTGGLGNDAFDDVIKDSKKASEGIDDIKESIDDIKPDGIEDTVKGLKNTDTKAEDAHGALKKIAQTSFDKTVSGLKKMAGALGTVAKKAAKLVAKGLVAGAAGVGALTTMAVKNYADYEQLVGGVETLFKDSAGTVQLYADNAYKSAGLSANDYMETVTAFSASLIQSLGGNTGAAAEYANMAIIDMADNANKMGTDMSSIQDAYQGFAKQNYTMLDNLKLGYGGTKTEMERLLKDATALSGVKYDISSYADIVAAIHVIQTELGITGTTSKEASETISGSFNALKSAWSNTMTSLILGGDDFDRCVDNLIDSAKTFGKNVMPAIIKGLNGMGALITELAPIVERELPGIIDTLLPPLLKAATSLLKGIIKALPSIISTLIDELPTILKQVWSAFSDAFGEIPGMAKAEAFFNNLIGFIQRNADTIKKLVPALLGLVVAFKMVKKVQGLAGLFGGKGGSGGGIFSSLTNLQPTQALKGMANLAIILGGLAALAAVIMWVAPYMAQLSDIGSLAEVLLAITAVGLIGTAMATLAGKVGLIPVATVSKGLANIAIVMVGFGALAAVLMWLAPYITQLSDIKTTLKLLVIIAAVGLVGSALAGLAGLVGAIPITAVLTGLANIALALGGFTAIVTAFGALSTIDGFNEFLTKGGETLATICGIIGKMAGSIIGGIGEGVTDSLPAIGDNLSAFATSLQPMFTVFSGVDTDSLSSFATSFAAFIAVLVGEKLVSVITGGIDYEGLGVKLSAMATGLSGFFSTVMTFPDGCYEKATALFDCLAGIKGLPKDGGVVGWFEGEVDYAKMATGLMQLAGATGFFTAVQAIPEAAFTAATNLFNCLNGIGQLPNSGGVVQWFKGEVDYAGIAAGVQTLASEGMIAALTAITAIPAASYASLTALFDALAGVKQMPESGGIVGWFKGDSTTGLSNVSSQLPGVATNIASFFTNLGGRTDFTPIKTLFDTLSSIKIDSDAAEGRGFLGLGSSELEKMGSGLSNFATKAKTFLDEVNNLNADNLKTFFDNLGTAGELPDKLSGLNGDVGTELSNLVTTATTKMEEIKTAISTGIDSIVAVFTDSASAFQTAGGAMMVGLQIGMGNKLPLLIQTAQTMAAAIQNAFDVELKINSPSKTMTESGEFVGLGGVIGLRNMIPKAESAAQDFAIASTPFNDYTPEGSAETVYNSRSSGDVTSVAPVFNLSISGTKDDRAMARKVKQFVAEAIQETFESLERKSTVLREV